MTHSHEQGVVGVVHAYPSRYLLDSLGADGWRVALAGPAETLEPFREHPAVAAIAPLDLSDAQGAMTALQRLAASTPLACLAPVYEGGVVISARASQELGIPSMSPATAHASRNKYLSHLLWSLQDIPVPKTEPLLDTTQAWRVVCTRFGGAAVIKLADSMNSQGVILARDETSCGDAIRTLADMLGQDIHTPSSLDRNRFAYGVSDVKFIAQEYCDGVEVGVEVLLADLSGHVLGVFEKAPARGPFFAESMSVRPTSLGAALEREAGEIALRAARALGLTRGVAHVEMRAHEGRFRVLEAGLRPGGAYTAMAVERFSGVNEYACAVRAQLGLPVQTPCSAEDRALLYGGIVYPRSGVLRHVDGVETLEKAEGLLDLQILNSVGDSVHALPRSAQPHYCYYLLEAEDRETVLARHAEIQRAVRLFVDEAEQREAMPAEARA